MCPLRKALYYLGVPENAEVVGEIIWLNDKIIGHFKVAKHNGLLTLYMDGGDKHQTFVGDFVEE